jgi:hypothetical protein
MFSCHTQPVEHRNLRYPRKRCALDRTARLKGCPLFYAWSEVKAAPVSSRQRLRAPSRSEAK